MSVSGAVAEGGEDVVRDGYEIHYQEPPDSYFSKFKRNWALYFGFLILIYMFMPRCDADNDFVDNSVRADGVA
ncbi:hypothetical protein L1987_48317 [Smallanthus sonchifolius]|uniref:Uncharacterized protein n=1 Tax=Smallanthus sonchifolius TaxID=185202 RepID=A0ACB9FR02_9ASTR|nr:hypothetical protein L1987_48317 [Smallanthus sonchifolius]